MAVVRKLASSKANTPKKTHDTVINSSDDIETETMETWVIEITRKALIQMLKPCRNLLQNCKRRKMIFWLVIRRKKETNP